MNPEIKTLYKEISFKYNISIDLVKKIVDSQFKFVKDVMASGIKNQPNTFKSIQLTHLGKFAKREYKLQEYKRKADEKK